MNKNSFNILDAKRKRALSNQDAETYYKACVMLGIEPEDEFLFERGKPVKINLEKKFQKNVKKFMSDYGLNGGAVNYD